MTYRWVIAASIVIHLSISVHAGANAAGGDVPVTSRGLEAASLEPEATDSLSTESPNDLSGPLSHASVNGQIRHVEGLAPRFSESSFREFDTQRIVKRTVVVTSLFAGACFALLLYGRRLQSKRGMNGQSVAKMQILDTLPLAPRCTLQLVRVDNQRFLVARDSGGVRSITPVNTFAEELEDAAPLGDPVPSKQLTKASATGLSLEGSDFPHWSRDTSMTRRKDPWTGPTFNP